MSFFYRSNVSIVYFGLKKHLSSSGIIKKKTQWDFCVWFISAVFSIKHEIVHMYAYKNGIDLLKM